MGHFLQGIKKYPPFHIFTGLQRLTYSLVIIAVFQAVLEAFLTPVLVSKQPPGMDEHFHQSDQFKQPKQHKTLHIRIKK